MRHPRGHVMFLAIYGLGLATAVAWLILGLLPALAAGSDAIHDGFHRAGSGSGPLAEIARNAAQTSHSVESAGHVVLDYLVSAFNLVVAAILVKLRPRDGAARLLSLGLIGSAIAFNLQGHDALQVIPVALQAPVETWHFWVHIGSGLSYMFALLMFPHGRLLAGPAPVVILRVLGLVFLTLFLTGLAGMTATEHTVGLVILFGIAIPVVGLATQIVRYLRTRDEQQRQQSRVLIWALAAAAAIAIPLMIATGTFEALPPSETVAYEVEIDDPATYYFRCDPHPADMRGIVRVEDSPAAPDEIELASRESRFDKNTLVLPADETATITFTNYDADLHNVAIYRDAAMTDPIFIGEEFSGRPQGAVAFRIFRIVFALIPIALLVDLARFRLWDINRVLNRALVYGLIAGFITLAYVLLIAALGATFGVGSRMNLVASVIVTIVIAASFQPLRDRARKLANRIVYGERATPYEQLSEFSARMGGRYDLHDVIPQLARLLAEGTAAERSEVWLRADGGLIRAASWPPSDEEQVTADLSDGLVPDLPGRDRVIGVTHGSDLLGALSITKPPGKKITPVEERLLEDAASHAGLALKNVQLTSELSRRLEELRASRQRLVAAQDAERRRLERDIHDGVQQHLVAMSMKLRLAQELAERDPQRAQEVMADLQADTGETLQALRDLARGIHPPVLSDHGVVAALEAHARRTQIEVRIDAPGIGRFASDIETAVYFCCLEAVQNAAKHSGATHVAIRLEERDDVLCFEIHDDGRGFALGETTGSGLQNMSDRLASLSGSLEVRSSPGEGTTVVGKVPLVES
ncbi:MAG: hypothetical protein KY391_04710 [Actinobacteria bacterium]|nr:hypothetical protein [Actinomycetota bacterium]